uniref:BTB domain-containing protein n=1 Tax=Ciona intestinalis TaxID=7719 RepID=H2XR86_CIOIN
DVGLVSHLQSSDGETKRRYSDPSLPSKMMKHFNDLRHHKKFVDVIVTSPSKKIRLDCHSLVLSSGSNFFEPILSLGGDAECEFEVTEVKEGVLEALVSFIYTGKVGVNNHNVSKLMQGSDRMQLSEIIEGCAEYLETTTNAHNCVQHRSIAIDYKCNKLKETAMSCIAEHFSQVSRSTDFLLLSVGGLIEVMTSNDLHLDAPLCEGEMSVFNAIRRWISHDEENINIISKVMSVVRFPLMNQQKLIDHVISDLLVMESDALCGLVTRVISQKPFHAFDEPVYMRGNEYIITLGGSSPVSDITSEHVTVYDATHDRFHELTTLPETRALHCAVACDQYVFVVGGFDSYSCIVNNVHCFDLASGIWEDMPHLKIKRACFSLHVVSGFLYAVGGLTPNGYTSSVERLDRSRKTWELAAALPSTRYRHAGCVYKGEVLVTGGCEKLDSVLSYNPKVNEWKKCKPMNVGRDSHVMAVANDKAFVI